MSSTVGSKDSLSVQSNILSHDKDSVNLLPTNSSFKNYDLKPMKEETIPNTNKEVEEQTQRQKVIQKIIQVQAEDVKKCLLSKSEKYSEDINDNELKNMMETIKDLTYDVQNLRCIVSEYYLINLTINILIRHHCRHLI
jgi:hypothetical protein